MLNLYKYTCVKDIVSLEFLTVLKKSNYIVVYCTVCTYAAANETVHKLNKMFVMCCTILSVNLSVEIELNQNRRLFNTVLPTVFHLLKDVKVKLGNNRFQLELF